MNKFKVLIFSVLFLILSSASYLNIKALININSKIEQIENSIVIINEYTIDEINQELECVEKDLDYLFGVGDACEKSFPKD